jgi:hypothetical protein
VTLNEDGTRLLRAFRDDAGTPGGVADRPKDDSTTTELRIPRPDA